MIKIVEVQLLYRGGGVMHQLRKKILGKKV